MIIRVVSVRVAPMIGLVAALVSPAFLLDCGGKVVVDGDPNATSDHVSSATTVTAASTGAGGAGGSATTATTGVGGTGAGGFDAGPDAPPPPPPVAVYAHSGSTLYLLDPGSKAVSKIGDFQGCSGVIDIAVDRTGAIYGATSGALYTIDRKTAACTFVAKGAYPNSLSFVPQGTVDPDAEALVGYLASTYVRVDPVSGAVTPLGNLGGGFKSSGDLFSLIGEGTYLTVDGNGCSDCLVQVDPSTGAMTTMIGKLAYGQVWGLAYWGGFAYGFNSGGILFQIALDTAAVTTIPIPNAPPGLSFWGAGSSTAAMQ